MRLSVNRSYQGYRADVRQRLSAMDAKLQSKYGARTRWLDEWTLAIAAPGVNGQLSVGDRRVQVDLEVSSLLRPLKGRIEKQLTRELDQVV